MSDRSQHSNYRVYFFLYLAVVCELLIIIVERDDAEAGWLKERELLQRTNEAVIRELLSKFPIAVSNGASQMRVGEVSPFYFSVKGMGNEVGIVRSPIVRVYHNGNPVGELQHPAVAEDSTRTADGEKTYAFRWRAPAVGRWEFRGETGTDFVSLLDEDSVRIGSLTFARPMLEEQFPDIGRIIGMGEHISSTLAVDVVSQPDQLGIHAENIVTAAGYVAENSILAEGTASNRVASRVDRGSGTISGGTWVGSFDTPGLHTVEVGAHDTRGEGGRSVARKAFTVEVREPVLTRAPRLPLYAKETADLDISVAGLEDRTLYAWTLTERGRVTGQGSGPVIHWKPSEPGIAEIRATYAGKPYPVKGQGSSNFRFDVAETPTRILNATFAQNAEYPIEHKFQFVARRCGRRPDEFSEAVRRHEIRVDAEDDQGNDLLRDLDVQEMKGYSVITFFLRGKATKDGMNARISVRAGAASKTCDVVLYKD